jgi:hypothetical protein
MAETKIGGAGDALPGGVPPLSIGERRWTVCWWTTGDEDWSRTTVNAGDDGSEAVAVAKVQLAAGATHACAIDNGSHVVAWQSWSVPAGGGGMGL